MNLDRRDFAWVFTGGVALAVLVAALGALDDRRAEGKLAVLSGEVCDVPLPPRLLAPLDRLFDPARRERANSRAIVERLEARLATDRPVRLYFETEAALWSVTRWEEASRNGAFSWPPSLGRWEELAWSSGCHGEVDGPRLLVARTVRTPKGRFAVLVVQRQRDRG